MRHKSLDSIIQDFDPSHSESGNKVKDGSPVTIWLPNEYKEAYDRIQKTSGRGFSKKLRELVLSAIDLAGKRSA